MGERIDGASIAARALKARGITRVFALCGDHINALYHALRREGIDIVSTRHESAAVQMADGSARVSGQPGVAVVTGGPGHTNAITGAAVALGAQSPVVIISGQARKSLRERGGNQSLHQADLMRPVVKWAIEAETPDCTGELLTRALTVAVSGTPGPVSVSIPVDVATAECRDPHPAASVIDLSPTAVLSEKAVNPLAQILLRSRRPVAVVGGNAWAHGSDGDVARHLRALRIPCFTNGQSRGVLPDDGKYGFGYANPLFNTTFRCIEQADCVLLVGTTLDYSFGSGKNCVVSPDARIAQIHRDPSQIGIGHNPQVAVIGDHAAVLGALRRSLTGRDTATRWSAWQRELRRHHLQKQRYWQQLGGNNTRMLGGVHPAALCRALTRHWTGDTTLVFDVGDFTNWPKAWFPALKPARFMDGGALGNLGGALPLAIGAQFASGRKPVWAFIGDGGFGFHGWELSVLAEHDLPLKIIVGNDRCWGTEKRLQLAEFGSDIGCDLPALRHDRFAQLFGIGAYRVTREADLAKTVSRFVEHKGPALLDVGLVQLAGRPFQKPVRP